MADRDAPPLLVIRKHGGRLFPATAYDAEALERWPDGTDFEAKSLTKRSLPHHRLYWQALKNAVEATGRWPSTEALHTALKIRLGRFEPVYDLKGQVVGMKPDSTAFAAMTQADFREYFDAAIAVLAEAIGADPLAMESAA